MIATPTLILTACLLVDGVPSSTCKDVSIQIEQTMTPEQCSGRMGQIVMAKWVEEHPQWWITRWSCPDPKKAEQST